jgi:hypothetical protein
VSVADSVKATAAIAAAVADGDLTPMEAAELSKLVDAYTRAVGTIMTRSLKARLTRLEVKSGKASTRFIVVLDEAECNALAVAGSIPAGARLYQ